VTLWAAGATGSNKAGSDGRFELGTAETTANDVVLYLTAKEGEASINKGSGDNPAISLLAVLGSTLNRQRRHQRDDHRGVSVDE
jgi:hypothetical protein